MIALPKLAWGLITLLQWHLEPGTRNVVFAAEVAGIWMFSLYWLVENHEIGQTQADLKSAASSSGF